MDKNKNSGGIAAGQQESFFPDIRPLTRMNLEEYAGLLRHSFGTVAEDFGFTKENCPTHTSFVTNEQLAARYEEGGYRPYGCYADHRLVGFVSLTSRGNGVFELRNLAVLPDYRHSGYGKALIDFCKKTVAEWGGKKIRLGMIAENERLKRWYFSQGFIQAGSQKNEKLPYSIAFMEWNAL